MCYWIILENRFSINGLMVWASWCDSTIPVLVHYYAVWTGSPCLYAINKWRKFLIVCGCSKQSHTLILCLWTYTLCQKFLFICDIWQLCLKCIHQQFMAGNFSVKKTMKAFPAIAIDQAHEQNNTLVKGDGGTVLGLTKNRTAPKQYMFCGPEMARLLQQFLCTTRKTKINSSTMSKQKKLG